MKKFQVGDLVRISEAPSRICQVVDIETDEAGGLIYKIDNEGGFYFNNLKFVSSSNTDSNFEFSDIKTVIVTGGAGYVGSTLIRWLLNNNYRVVCIDKLSFGASALIGVWNHPLFVFKNVDINKYSEIDKIISNNDCYGIVHLAAIVGDPACKLEPDLARKTNLDSSVYLVKKAIQENIERFVFASTCSNYGKMTDPAGYVDETSSLSPVSLYAKLKVEVEDFILNKIDKEDGFCPTCLRFATVYGISPRMRFDLTVNEFTKDLTLGRELTVFGEQFWRPYCHVKDFARAIQAVLEAPKEKVAYNVFNVGDTAENYTKRMIVDELIKVIPDGRVQYVRKEEDPRDYRVRFNKIQDELGFVVSKTVAEGIDEVHRSIKLGVVEDPDDQKFYNIPV